MRYSLSILLLSLLCWHCQSKRVSSPQPEVLDATAMVRMTHKEATDTLLMDSTRPMQPVLLTRLTGSDAQTVLAGIDLTEPILADWPDNGFYGDDRYRIEFIFTDVERTLNDPSVYAVKGKNRFKKTISNFEGFFEIKEISAFTDPNLDTTEIYDMRYEKMYTLAGEFRFQEDSSLNTSGLFSGTFKMDIGILQDSTVHLWFFSETTPAAGCGYRFDGTWTSYKKPDMVKPVIWSRDLFRFANDILEEFSYGERDVEINEKYRHLGWDTFWEGDEWWNDSPRKDMQ